MDTTQDNIIALTVLDKEDDPVLVLPFAHYHSLRAYWKQTGYKWRAYKLQRVKPSDFNSLRAGVKLRIPNPGSGYRLLTPGDVLEEGDEWWSETSNRWVRTIASGDTPGGTTPYRRCIAGPGYMLLKPGDLIEPGDEYLFSHDGEDGWMPTACTGMNAPTADPGNKAFGLYRRKLEQRVLPEPPEGYYRMSSIEIIDRSDIFHSGEKWEPARVTGTPVGALAGMYARPLKGFNKQTPDGTAGKDAKHELITT
jgi:hypothetical protein